MEADFLPEPSPDTLIQVDRRMANAAMYIAYHLCQTDKTLDRLLCSSRRPRKKAHEFVASATVTLQGPRNLLVEFHIPRISTPTKSGTAAVRPGAN